MKTILVHLVAIFELIGFSLVLAEFFNVSSMKGVEDIYFRMKRRRPSVRPPQEEKLKAKQDVCLAILGSEFFDTHHMVLVNPDDKTIYDQVRDQNPQIHEKHYSSRLSLNPAKPKFANPYRIRDVSAHGKVTREYMFTCLVKNCSTKNIEQYFISPEYNTDGLANMVRFVFIQNKENGIVIFAMAEKSSGSSHSIREARITECPPEESTEEQEKNFSDDSNSW